VLWATVWWDGAVESIHTDLAPVPQTGYGQPGQLLQHRRQIGGAGQHGADLGQIAGLLAGPQGVGLGGDGSAFGAEGTGLSGGQLGPSDPGLLGQPDPFQSLGTVGSQGLDEAAIDLPKGR
jgi:hypothetical protein